MIEEMKIKYNCEEMYEDKHPGNCKNNKCSCIELVIATLSVLFIGVLGAIIGAAISEAILGALAAVIVLAIVLFILFVLSIIILICCKNKDKKKCCK